MKNCKPFKIVIFSTLFFLSMIGYGQNQTEKGIPVYVSAQFGPETGISFITPKFAARHQEEGLYFGAFISINVFAVLTLSAGPIIGYKKGSIALESSLSATFVGDYDSSNGKNPSKFFLNVNPKVVISVKPVFASFGPSFYLYKSKKVGDDTLWDDLAKAKLGSFSSFNYEIGGWGFAR
jgi:hypothetical protein